MITLGDYLDENNLDFDNVILKNEKGEVITRVGTLLQYCFVLSVDGKEITIQ